MYKVMVSRAARQRLRKMPENIAHGIIGRIEQLAADPFAPNNNLTALKGGGHRLCVGDWRVLYAVDTEARTMTVAAILPRGEAYR